MIHIITLEVNQLINQYKSS